MLLREDAGRMMDKTGKMWIYVEGNSRIPWVDKLGIPLLINLSDLKPNDCVMLFGIQAQKTRAILEKLQRENYTFWIMNGNADKLSSLSNNEIERRLRREGLPVKLGAVDTGAKPITISVWGLEAIEMRSQSMKFPTLNGIKLQGNQSDWSSLTVEHSIWKPAERISARALYALGLDLGQVEVLFNKQGEMVITAISSRINVLGEGGKQRFGEVLSAFKAAWEDETDNGVQAKLGADPEFILRSPDGRIVPASRYFSPVGEAGCDSVRIQGIRRWPLVELRPRPSREPSDVTADVRRLLKVASQRTAGIALTWQAGAMPVPGLPLGGHIHLSGVLLTSERLRALDNAVALPLRLLEPITSAKRRPRYGSLGDVRRQPHGGFEYRTPASWLVSPRLALGAFALAKVAAEHSRELAFERPLDEECYREAFYRGDRMLLLEAVERIYERIKRTSGYLVYREAIDFIFNAIKRNRSWDESLDIRIKWRIPIH